MWGIVFFFPATAPAAAFIESLESIKETATADSRLASVEILDQKSLEIIDHFKENHPSFRDIPHVDTTAGMAVYLELHGEDETAMADLAEQLMDAVRENEGDPDASLAATTRGDLSRLRLFRKAAPHATNFLTARVRQTDERITRLGYDWIQSWSSLDEPFKRIESDMTGAGLTGAVYGHALDQCLHVNLLPCDYATYRAGKQLIRQWSQTEGKGHL
jgi:D-lactate dehydrogenase (cytochrome)